MATENLWNVVYWRKGETRAAAAVLTHTPVSYTEARSKAKRARYLPAFFGYVLDVQRA